MLLSFLLLTSIATAEEPGKFTIMGTNECAQYEGVLFNVTATAEILSRANIRTAECNLIVDTELEKKEIEFDLERENFDIRYTSLKDEYNLTLEQKDLEIQSLQETIRKHSPRNKWVWYAAGAASGIAVTYGAYRAFNNE
jgi:hypothetical protein